MLLPRFLTALLGVPLLVLSIWFGQVPFFTLIFGIIMLSLYEYFSLAEESVWPVSKKTGLICGALLTVTIFLFGTNMGWSIFPKMEVSLTPAMLSAILITLVIVALLSKDKENAFMKIALTMLGIFYVAWTLSHLLLIRDLRPMGLHYTFFLFLVVWSLDIGAYLGGKKLGKHRMSEKISPKKTWEGVVVGSCSALVVAIICQRTFLSSMGISEAVVLGLMIVVLAQISDMSESLFKRNVNVKDSGNLLPGHGGILDRFDSFFLTAPVYYYALVYYLI